jgi:ribose transport system permease protein
LSSESTRTLQLTGQSWLSDFASAAISAVLLLAGVVVLAVSPGSGQVAGSVVAEGSAVALASVGLTLVLRSGRLDLSVAGVAALAGVLAARIELGGQPLLLALVAGVALGAGAGLINGLLGSLSRMAAVAATVATAAVAVVIAYQASGSGQILAIHAEGGQVATTGFVLAILAGAGVTLLLFPKIAGAGLDAPAREEDRTALISVAVVVAFVCSGALAALAGVVEAAWVGLAQPAPATSLLLEAIAAALIGGSALRGRSGTGFGAVLASFAIAALLTALALHGAGGEALIGISGGLVVVGVLFSEARSRLTGL